MSDEIVLLLRMINEGRTLNEMSDILHLSNKQLFMKLSMLRNSGYLFDRHYSYDGNISYSISNPFGNSPSGINIETPDDLQTIRALLTSDTHLGNINDTIDCLDSMMEYCIKEDIHIIFNVGDFFEGIYKNPSKSKYTNANEQLTYGIKAYPYDKNILTIVILGNHDATFWSQYGIDVRTILSERRHDIIPIGYEKGVVKIGFAQFSLQHPLGTSHQPKSYSNMITLRGHSHKFKINANGSSLVIYVPTISKVPVPQLSSSVIPSMIDMTLKIKNGIIYDEYFQQLLFIDNQPCRIGEFQYYIPIAKQEILPKQRSVVPYLEDNIKLEKSEETVAEQVSKTVLDTINEVLKGAEKQSYRGMSQIEKFNARYSKVLHK